MSFWSSHKEKNHYNWIIFRQLEKREALEGLNFTLKRFYKPRKKKVMPVQSGALKYFKVLKINPMYTGPCRVFLRDRGAKKGHPVQRSKSSRTIITEP